MRGRPFCPAGCGTNRKRVTWPCGGEWPFEPASRAYWDACRANPVLGTDPSTQAISKPDRAPSSHNGPYPLTRGLLAKHGPTCKTVCIAWIKPSSLDAHAPAHRGETGAAPKPAGTLSECFPPVPPGWLGAPTSIGESMKRALLAVALAIATCFAAFGQQASGLVIFSNAGTTGAKTAVNSVAKVKTYQAWGVTSSGSGAAVILVQGSGNGGVSWDTIGTISLTLSTTTISDSFTSDDRYPMVRGNVSSISGTGAVVSLMMGQ